MAESGGVKPAEIRTWLREDRHALGTSGILRSPAPGSSPPKRLSRSRRLESPQPSIVGPCSQNHPGPKLVAMVARFVPVAKPRVSATMSRHCWLDEASERATAAFPLSLEGAEIRAGSQGSRVVRRPARSRALRNASRFDLGIVQRPALRRSMRLRKVAAPGAGVAGMEGARAARFRRNQCPFAVRGAATPASSGAGSTALGLAATRRPSQPVRRSKTSSRNRMTASTSSHGPNST